LKPAYNADQAAKSDNTLLARRLRETLLATTGWVKRAAREGDAVADKLVDEIDVLLDVSEHLD
jgi:hypothetical protein